MKLKTLFMIFVILNCIDGILTYYAISNNIAKEQNPTMDFMINNGWILFWFVKISLVSIVLYVASTIKSIEIQKYSIMLLCCAYIGVVSINLFQIYKGVYL